MDERIYTNLKITRLPKSLVEFTAEIKPDALEKFRKEALEHLRESASVPGFRKGHVTDEVLISRMGEQEILKETAEHALAEAIPQIIVEEKFDTIGRPEVVVTKLAPGNPIEFKARAALLPPITLPDYKAIAKKELSSEEKTDVTQEELEAVITRVRESKKTMLEGKEILPDLTDDFVKTLGAFQTVEEFKKILMEDLTKDKIRRAKDKKRSAIAEKIAAEATIDLPDILVEGELNRMLMQFRGDVESLSLKFDDYLKNIKKTEADLRGEWRPQATLRAKLQLALHQIAKVENITANIDEITAEVKHLTEHHKDTDPARARAYIETLLTNEKVLEFLEAQR